MKEHIQDILVGGRPMTKLEQANKEIERLNNIIKDKKERVEIAIRLLLKMFGTDDYEINYVMGILSGDRQIHFEELKGDSSNGNN